MEAAACLRQIDRENPDEVLAVVDNSINTLSSRIYNLRNVVSSVIDVVQSDMSSLYHGQS